MESSCHVRARLPAVPAVQNHPVVDHDRLAQAVLHDVAAKLVDGGIVNWSFSFKTECCHSAYRWPLLFLDCVRAWHTELLQPFILLPPVPKYRPYPRHVAGCRAADAYLFSCGHFHSFMRCSTPSLVRAQAVSAAHLDPA